MPASRSARAMIFAPRSWPSRPGFATTTLIRPAATIGEYTSVRLTVVGSSPAWPNPGGAQSGYLVEGAGTLLLDCGPGVLARLRQARPWPEIDAIAISHFHLDHWGDLVPWAWGTIYGPGRFVPRVTLHVPPGGHDYLAALGPQFGGERDMFERAFDLREYAEGVPGEAAGFELLPVRVHHYDIATFAFRVSDGHRTVAY